MGGGATGGYGLEVKGSVFNGKFKYESTGEIRTLIKSRHGPRREEFGLAARSRARSIAEAT